MHAIAARLCDATTMERLVDPTLSDLRLEYEEAVKRGRRLESARIWLVGHIALLQVIALHGGLSAAETVRDLAADDRRALVRTLSASTATVIVGTFVLALVPFVDFVPRDHPRSLELAFYLVPQALALSIPIGLTVGILWGLGCLCHSARTRTVVLLLALMTSALSLVMMAWVVPNSNQAFRVSMTGGPLPKGLNELTIRELRRRLDTETLVAPAAMPADSLSLSFTYHQRWALGSAPLVLALFAVAFARRRRWGRLIPLPAACLAISAYYIIMYSARGLGLHGSVSPFAAAWAPNAAFLMLSLAMTRFSLLRTNGTGHA